jgi:hypothetical protein
LEETLVVIGMFFLRLGVPLLITFSVGYGLRRLDARWQAEAQGKPVVVQSMGEIDPEIKTLKPERPCWEIMGCTERQRAGCPACELLDIPCWVAQLRTKGRLPELCVGCELFRLTAKS